MLIRAETAGQSLRIHGKKGCRGGWGGGAESEKQEETKKLEKREEQLCEDAAAALKEDATCRSQSRHLVVNPRP